MPQIVIRPCVCGGIPLMRKWSAHEFYVLCVDCGREGECVNTPRDAADCWNQHVVGDGRRRNRCAHCGTWGVTTGHSGCQFPQDEPDAGIDNIMQYER